MSAWQKALAEAFTEPAELLDFLELPSTLTNLDAQALFKLRVPTYFAGLMAKGDPNDPLLQQVLPRAQETIAVPGFSGDPLGEQASPAPGLLHKYASRVLLIFRGGCAVNCRYCFRREFPYAELTLTRRRRDAVLEYIASKTEVNEVIFSGGDPLLASDEELSSFVGELAGIAHLRRIRVHTRTPVVMPERLTPGLLEALTHTRLKPVLSLHSNHPNEISPVLAAALAPFAARMPVLNQTVLLRQINDQAETLAELSEKLFDAGVQPYYLFQLDRVTGAAHFEVDLPRAREIYQALQTRLPGFLLPRFAQELPGQASKTLLL